MNQNYRVPEAIPINERDDIFIENSLGAFLLANFRPQFNDNSWENTSELLKFIDRLRKFSDLVFANDVFVVTEPVTKGEQGSISVFIEHFESIDDIQQHIFELSKTNFIYLYNLNYLLDYDDDRPYILRYTYKPKENEICRRLYKHIDAIHKIILNAEIAPADADKLTQYLKEFIIKIR